MDSFIPNSDNDIDTTFIGESPTQRTRTRTKRTRIRNINIQNANPAESLWTSGWNQLTVSPFEHRVGLKVATPASAFGFFRLFITEYIVSFMVMESNKYAMKTLGEEEFAKFNLITVDEMNKFICIIIYMGIGDLPTYEMYWKKKDNPLYSEFCGKLMTFERFSTIKRYFHVFDNEIFDQLGNQQIKFSKLDGLIAYFNNKFNEIYDPEKELAVDENMCSWSGNGGSKVYMPLKPVKYGMKMYAMCESKTGYACSLIQYNSNKKEGILEMLTRLTAKYINKFHHIYMDNFYSSKKNFDELLKLGIYCCGTLRENRGGPKGLKKDISKLRKGEGYIFKSDTANCIGMMDNGRVVILTNIHSTLTAENIDENALLKNLNNTNVVDDYNSYMGGVDLMDQMTRYYGINRRSRKWTTKLCFHLLNIAIHNSYVMYKKYSTVNQKKTT